MQKKIAAILRLKVTAAIANILGCVAVRKPKDCLPYRLIIKGVNYD